MNRLADARLFLLAAGAFRVRTGHSRFTYSTKRGEPRVI
jgi:hypothetical protein